MSGVFSSPDEFIARHAEIRLIELKRGSTLKLEHAAGVTVRLVNGEAWLSACRGGEGMRAGEPAVLNGRGTVLIYALADSSLCLEGMEQCDVELRRRGEVASGEAPADDAQS
jgi:hypothetical protein